MAVRVTSELKLVFESWELPAGRLLKLHISEPLRPAEMEEKNYTLQGRF